ncbi:hypothetical protein ACIGO9_34965 [Nocardia asteroides]|uniref:hypothetical protein n=1 Tax=Nocardia asteroides TaxID=1824 RepID=UPI0037CBCA24
MSTESQSDRGHHPDGFAEFTEELRLLAEVLLARVEPVLRRTAADGQADLGGCSWCPVCAAAALVRGEHHDVVAALADHGTAMVTVLREALAGVPVEPVLPPEWAEYAAAHHDSHGAYGYDDTGHAPDTTGWPADDAARSGDGSGRQHAGTAAHARAHTGAAPTDHADGPPGADTKAARAGSRRSGDATPPSADGHDAAGAHADPGATPTDTARPAGRSRPRWGSARSGQTPRPRRVDEFEAPRQPDTAATGQTPPAPDNTPGTGPSATQPAGAARDDRSRSTRAPRSRYVDIPVTIRG